MSIEAKCQCGAKLRVKNQAAGKRVKCPQCGQAVTVPLIEENDDSLDAYDLGSELPLPSASFPKTKDTSTKGAAQLPGPSSNSTWGNSQTIDQTASAAKEEPQSTSVPTSMTVSTVYAVAIVSYLTLAGWAVAAILHYKSDSKYASLGGFHLRQSLGIHTTGFILGLPPLIIRLAGGEDFAWLISYMFYPISLLLFVVWILGLISAFQGTEEEVPLVGEGYQKVFQFIS